MWNDLSENDVIYPSDGVEYVLKGSEIFPGCSSSGTHLSFASISFEFYLPWFPSFSPASTGLLAAEISKSERSLFGLLHTVALQRLSPFLHNLVIREDF